MLTTEHSILLLESTTRVPYYIPTSIKHEDLPFIGVLMLSESTASTAS